MDFRGPKFLRFRRPLELHVIHRVYKRKKVLPTSIFSFTHRHDKTPKGLLWPLSLHPRAPVCLEHPYGYN